MVAFQRLFVAAAFLACLALPALARPTGGYSGSSTDDVEGYSYYLAFYGGANCTGNWITIAAPFTWIHPSGMSPSLYPIGLGVGNVRGPPGSFKGFSMNVDIGTDDWYATQVSNDNAEYVFSLSYAPNSPNPPTDNGLYTYWYGQLGECVEVNADVSTGATGETRYVTYQILTSPPAYPQ